MTREEAIKCLRLDGGIEISGNAMRAAKFLQALSVAITAIQPVSREQAEKMWKAEDDSPHEKGRWFHCTNCGYGCDDYYSHDEEQMPNNNFQFCPCCGKAATDDAVQMVMERLEELKDEAD